MSARLIASGNLGGAPSLRQVDVDGETRAVADMRIFFDRPVPLEDGGFADEGGFWLSVSTWGRLAEHCAHVLHKGMRVRVEGRLREHAWDSEDGPRVELRLTADKLTLELARLDTVTLKPRTAPPASGQASDDAPPDADA
ncbi:hypothetical protein M911_07835 [Ectothiorhodospira haloalkaliphila]|uniref:Single-stranded DNA-binding protein n=2 Tax=Ectothiorhodospira haloalkaliphila TaxID=421628 RepID=W8KH25_9GAMM|nr:hypothetical protein M911_07835 [Ectothiorhodospira haloalkaliphila]